MTKLTLSAIDMEVVRCRANKKPQTPWKTGEEKDPVLIRISGRKCANFKSNPQEGKNIWCLKYPFHVIHMNSLKWPLAYWVSSSKHAILACSVISKHCIQMQLLLMPTSYIPQTLKKSSEAS